METRAHALLSASSSNRWLNCTASVNLTKEMEDQKNVFTAEGEVAHALAEQKLNHALGLKELKAPTDSEFYNNEMEEHTESYVNYIMELVAELKKEGKDPVVLVEQLLDFSDYVKDSFGTADAVIVADGIVHVIDFKYGRGVLVDANENSQMMLYSLGAIALLDCLYDVDKVSMTIYQPRLSNISTYETTKKELLKWAKKVLIPKAKEALSDKAKFCCGDWCKFCKAKSCCRERAKHNLELARFEFKEAPLLTLDEIAEVLLDVDTLVSWAEDVKEYAFKEAMNGRKIPGFKLVEGRSNRKFTDDEAVAKVVLDAGYDPYDKKLVGITEMQKRLGKKCFTSLLENYVFKPAGKPTLVVVSDKRPELNTAKEDFMTVEEKENVNK